MAGDFIDIWVTCPDRATAERIAEHCVNERLAACANILAPVTSLYRWKGKVERDEEVALLLKTRAGLFEAVCRAARPLHPYEVPAIVATPLTHIDRPYADWLGAETREGT